MFGKKTENAVVATEERTTEESSAEGTELEENKEAVTGEELPVVKSSKKKRSKKEMEALDEERLASIKDADLKAIAELLQEIRNENKREMKYAKTQMRLAVFTSFISLVIIIIVAAGMAYIVPRMTILADQADTIMQQTDEMMVQAQTVMDNLEQVTNELSESDISGMLEDVDSLVVSSEENMAAAAQKIMDIDIDSLNQAIEDLGSVVSPLAKLFGR